MVLDRASLEKTNIASSTAQAPAAWRRGKVEVEGRASRRRDLWCCWEGSFPPPRFHLDLRPREVHTVCAVQLPFRSSSRYRPQRSFRPRFQRVIIRDTSWPMIRQGSNLLLGSPRRLHYFCIPQTHLVDVCVLCVCEPESIEARSHIRQSAKHREDAWRIVSSADDAAVSGIASKTRPSRANAHRVHNRMGGPGVDSEHL